MTDPAAPARPVLCAFDDIPDPGAREVMVGGAKGRNSVLVVRHGETVAAYRNRCPHFQIPLNARPDTFLTPGEGLIMCAFHSAVFRLSDGLCVDGPCKGARLEPVAVARQGDLIVAA